MADGSSDWSKKDKTVKSAAKKAAKKAGVPLDFVTAFYRDAAPGDVLSESIDVLVDCAVAAYQAAGKRKLSAAYISIDNPSVDSLGAGVTRIVIVNDDMPFLVDTVTGLMTDLGVDIRRIFHPMVTTSRTHAGVRTTDAHAETYRESIIFLDVDRRGPQTRAKMQEGLEAVLADNRACVEDWKAMLRQLSRCASDLKYGEHGLPAEQTDETIAFLEWLAEENFTLLGYRYYALEGESYRLVEDDKAHKALGVLRDPDNKVWRSADGMTDASPELVAFLNSPEPLLITKANARATVHRRVHMDYVGVKAFDDKGALIGEHRFVGLFTSTAYARQARSIPLLRGKIEAVCLQAGFERGSHAGKALLHILETFPRDELFQITVPRLFDTALGILSLNERPRARVFIRPDRFERFVSVMAYVPREQYAGALRERLGDLLSEAFNGTVSTFFVQLSDSVLTRVQYIIRTQPGHIPKVDEAAIDAAVERLVKGWSAQFLEGLSEAFGEEQGRRLFYEIRDSYNAAYREEFTAQEAVRDMQAIRQLLDDESRDRGFRLYQRGTEEPHQAHLKIYRQDQILALSDSLPVLENMGLRVIDEVAFSIGASADEAGWVHDFLVENASGKAIDCKAVAGPVEDALDAVACGRRDDDGYNALILSSGLTSDDVLILRAYGHFIRQVGVPFTRSYVESCLVRNPSIASQLMALFRSLFDPASKAKAAKLKKDIETALEAVEAQDDDRILRLFLSVIEATLRTNAFIGGKNVSLPDTVAFKIRSKNVSEMPEPMPYAEIYVFGPEVEGVHLRGGPVARGGLRWTDRPEDYRTEVLGLLKAQIVKNSVIVPVGAKGGFLPRRLPEGGTRDEIFEAGRAAYKVFISHLIALTDNIVDGAIVAPQNVVRRDENDPYLVVAADKGTATFSDTANAIAEEAGFWLGDAFASGGSKGYDHKKMGITAKGGWVSVQRHFREMGINVQKEPFDVVGVGDMSGDVFGNGMLLSDQIRLIGAFDHRNIFIDPDPDPAKSFKERRRLFGLPRSSWLDYDTAKLSKGGAIFDRAAKKLDISPEIMTRFDLPSKSVTPQQLMQAVLSARADLLWFGGIGTYVKGPNERNGDVGDRANDAIRVDGNALRVKVIGEGANLGITQAGRLSFAGIGGRLNADFIDNSAGVDCSDNEVNLKIALGEAISAGALEPKDRDALLERMTDAVSEHVLRDNYLQTQSISMAEAQASKNLDRHAALIRRLEREGRINRTLDGLPGEDKIADLAKSDEGLTRPEIASLMCHAKIALFDALVASDVVDDPALDAELLAAFPEAVSGRYSQAVRGHRLRREIIATKLANAVINRGGLTLAFELDDLLDCRLAQVVAAFVVVRQAFDLRGIWRGIDAGDYVIPANIQTLMHAEVAFSLRRQMLQLLQVPVTDQGQPWTISAALDHIGQGVAALMKSGVKPLDGVVKDVFLERRDMYVEQGAGKAVSASIAALDAFSPALIIVNAARDENTDVIETSSAYFRLAKSIGADWLRQQLTDIVPVDAWERRALSEMERDLADQQARLVRAALSTKQTGKAGPKARVTAWLEANAAEVKSVKDMVMAMEADGPATVTRLGYATRVMRNQLIQAP